MNNILKEKIEEIKQLCLIYNIKTLYAFGSVCTNDFNETSDIDFLIGFKKDISIEAYTENYFALHYQFQNLFGRKIDLLTENSLSNPFFIKSINQTKKLIYES